MSRIKRLQKCAIFLMGPTAAGKTSLAMRVAKLIPVDIISVDSAMIYQGMDIGTGKPKSNELKMVPHALIDILDPKESYSAAQFCHDAYALMEQSINNKRIPMLVGGTMMYFNSLQQGLSTLPQANPQVRDALLKEGQQHGWKYLHDRLHQLDPIAAQHIHPNDPQRIQRALEVITITGRPFAQQLINKTELLKDWQIQKIVLAPTTRAQLHDFIALRFMQMLEQGFIEEVELLYKRNDLYIGLPSIRSVGYRQIWQYLAGQYTKQEMIDKSIVATRQLAKRQFTWLRKWTDLVWLDNTKQDLVASFLLEVNKLISLD
jgi:tRNA dimethylallyltransferase